MAASSSEDEATAQHLVLVVPGMGNQWAIFDDGLCAFDNPREKLERRIAEMRALATKLKPRVAKDNGLDDLRVAFRQADWHEDLSALSGINARIKQVTPKSSRSVRDRFVNDTLMDVLFYISPVHHDTILAAAASRLNAAHASYLEAHPDFKGRVSIFAHSLGSVICHDLISSEGEPGALTLDFSPDTLFLAGSPLGVFLTIANKQGHGAAMFS